ncbi:MAG: hypothetical protein NVS9B15_11860 [Acidobacteriaceae bacterium]
MPHATLGTVPQDETIRTNRRLRGEPNDAERKLREILDQLRGAEIDDTLLAGNSLILYIGDKPLETGFSLWFEPTWHIGDSTGVILGSRQAQAEDKPTHDALGKMAARLRGKRIESISIDTLTHDIDIRFSSDYWLRTFVSDPTDEETWIIRQGRNGLKVVASATDYSLISATSPDTPS